MHYSSVRPAALLVCLLALTASAGCAQRKPQIDFTTHPRAEILKAALAEANYAGDNVQTVLAAAEYQPEIIARISKPAEGLAWDRYRRIFLQPERIADGVAYWQKHAGTLADAEEKYDVDAAVIVAILAVESRFGQYQGKHRVIDALATLGFEYPRRGDFFLSELAQFLLMTHEQGIDPVTMLGSYAGAMGMPQFISSSYRNWAVDGDGDGRADLWQSDADVIHSIANYFAEHQWQLGQPVAVRSQASAEVAAPWLEKHGKPQAQLTKLVDSGVPRPVGIRGNPEAAMITMETAKGNEHWITFKNFYVITRYNHSRLYALAVYQLSEAIAENYRATQP